MSGTCIFSNCFTGFTEDLLSLFGWILGACSAFFLFYLYLTYRHYWRHKANKHSDLVLNYVANPFIILALNCTWIITTLFLGYCRCRFDGRRRMVMMFSSFFLLIPTLFRLFTCRCRRRHVDSVLRCRQQFLFAAFVRWGWRMRSVDFERIAEHFGLFRLAMRFWGVAEIKF